MPDPRNLYTELSSIRSQIPGFAADAYNLQSQYGGQYLSTALYGTEDNLGLLENLGITNDFLDALNTRSATATRTNAFGDVAALDATRRSANPELYSLMNYADSVASNPRGETDVERMLKSASAGMMTPSVGEELLYKLTSPDGLIGNLSSSASAALARGGALSEAEQSKVAQNTRRAYAARGLYDSNQAVGAEIYDLDAMQQQRLRDAQTLATNTASLSSNVASSLGSLANSRYSNALGGLTSAGNLANSRESLNASNVQTALAARQANAIDPLALLNANAGANQNSSANILGLSTAFGGSAPDVTGQLLNYGSDLYNTNFNAQSSAEIAKANGKASMTGSLIGAGSGIAAAAIIAF